MNSFRIYDRPQIASYSLWMASESRSWDRPPLRLPNAQYFFASMASSSMHLTRSTIVRLACSTTPLDWGMCGVAVSYKIPSNFRYSVNLLEVYSPPPSVWNLFTCLPDSFSLIAFQSVNVSSASDAYFEMCSSRCLVALLMKGSIYRPPPMAFSMGPHMSKCACCSGSVAWEVVGLKGFRANLQLMQLSQSHFSLIFSASATTFGKISKAFRPLWAMLRCLNIRFSALCRDACAVMLCGRRQLLLSISVYLVGTSGTQSRTNSSLT